MVNALLCNVKETEKNTKQNFIEIHLLHFIIYYRQRDLSSLVKVNNSVSLFSDRSSWLFRGKPTLGSPLAPGDPGWDLLLLSEKNLQAESQHCCNATGNNQYIVNTNSAEVISLSMELCEDDQVINQQTVSSWGAVGFRSLLCFCFPLDLLCGSWFDIIHTFKMKIIIVYPGYPSR